MTRRARIRSHPEAPAPPRVHPRSAMPPQPRTRPCPQVPACRWAPPDLWVRPKPSVHPHRPGLAHPPPRPDLRRIRRGGRGHRRNAPRRGGEARRSRTTRCSRRCRRAPVALTPRSFDRRLARAAVKTTRPNRAKRCRTRSPAKACRTRQRPPKALRSLPHPRCRRRRAQGRLRWCLTGRPRDRPRPLPYRDQLARTHRWLTPESRSVERRRRLEPLDRPQSRATGRRNPAHRGTPAVSARPAATQPPATWRCPPGHRLPRSDLVEARPASDGSPDGGSTPRSFARVMSHRPGLRSRSCLAGGPDRGRDCWPVDGPRPRPRDRAGRVLLHLLADGGAGVPARSEPWRTARPSFDRLPRHRCLVVPPGRLGTVDGEDRCAAISRHTHPVALTLCNPQHHPGGTRSAVAWRAALRR